LEYPSLGKFPDPPLNGYKSSGGDIGVFCCGSKSADVVEENKDLSDDETPLKTDEEAVKGVEA